MPVSHDRLQTILVDAVRHHQDGRLEEAEKLYRRVLRANPKHPDALHLLGVIAHQRGQNERARQLISDAIVLNDRDAAYHNNLGTVLLALHEPEAAAAALRRALALNPAYPEAHNNLGNALQALGRPDEAVHCYRRAARIRPTYAEAHANHGRALRALGDLAGAVTALQRAIALQPHYVTALKDLGDVLGESGRPGEAEARYRQALDVDPHDADVRAALAAAWEHASRLTEALAAAEAVLHHQPTHLRATVVAARCERRLGRPEDGLRRLGALHLDRLDPDSRAFASFELATIHDRLGNYDQAYPWFEAGNRLILASPAARVLDRDAFPKQVERVSQRFTSEWVASWTPPVPDSENAASSFLVGFPRSGTTLLDQVLDAHPLIATIEEKPMLDVVKHAIDADFGGYPDALATLTPDDLAILREIYHRETARYASAPPGGLLIDKMPLNAIDAGLIHRLFPDAKILLALRHPCDVVLSGFMQAFRPNLAMIQFGSLADTARLYVQVMALWRQYQALLPMQVITVRYEDLVADFSAEAARVLALLGVPWDDAVFAYADHARSRNISTPSYHQVVQPIYTRSIGRWRHYRSRLEPLLPMLQPYMDDFGYTRDGMTTRLLSPRPANNFH
ncbi:MAG: tetratricopeptide repeat protein [Rhodospirillales bacterium]|nr:tetratricopeptide repeat protein [Rhodospirillales bacterium]